MAKAGTNGVRLIVAVVSWNTRELLAECLSSLEPDARSGLAEVWVVDNASTDGSADLVRERFAWVSLIASEENLGFGPAVNLVAGQTSSAWIAPANADIRVSQGALKRLVEKGELHPETGVTAPRLILPDGSTQHSVHTFPTVAFALAYVLGLAQRSRSLARRWCVGAGFDPDEERDVPWAVGALLVVRRAAWDQVGGFDAGQWMYAEDLDLGWRLHRAGWTARYVPQARVCHDESAATRQAWGADRYARWHASSYEWLARRRGPGYARLLAAINVGGFLLRALLASPLALVGSTKSARTRKASINTARAHTVGLRSRSGSPTVR